MKKVTYIRCPRCELNYIQKKDKFCSVCKQEMQVGGGAFDELDLELCPICKTNYIQPDEVMCATCMTERANDPNFDKNNDWDAYLTRDEDEDIDGQDEEVGDLSTVKLLDDEDDEIDDEDDFEDLDPMGEDIDDEEEEKEEFFDDEDDDFDNYDEDDEDDED